MWRMRPGTHIHHLFYDAEVRLGIIKCMPRGPHEVLTRSFGYYLATLLAPTNLNVDPLGAKTFTNAIGSKKEADFSWRPTNRAYDEWPGLVLEVGYSQSQPSLRQTARWWLESRPLVTRQGGIYRGVAQVILIYIVRHPSEVLHTFKQANIND